MPLFCRPLPSGLSRLSYPNFSIYSALVRVSRLLSVALYPPFCLVFIFWMQEKARLFLPILRENGMKRNCNKLRIMRFQFVQKIVVKSEHSFLKTVKKAQKRAKIRTLYMKTYRMYYPVFRVYVIIYLSEGERQGSPEGGSRSHGSEVKARQTAQARRRGRARGPGGSQGPIH